MKKKRLQSWCTEKRYLQSWCMCTELKAVARDCLSTCSVCGGKDAYGTSKERPKEKQKKVILLNPIIKTRDLLIEDIKHLSDRDIEKLYRYVRRFLTAKNR